MSASSAPQLIQALQDPGCYPHPVQHIEVRETHISWVILTGEYAYKIKKPARLSFLDFSTLERRRYYCEQELRLNQRFAPELYLEVAPITGTRECPRVGGTGDPIEFAVRLKQFSSESELTQLLERDAVKPADLARFARRMAMTHAHSTAYTAAGAAEQVWRIVSANLLDLRGQSGADERFTRANQWLTAQFNRQRELLEQRGLNGRVCDCHGDLHAGNVVRLAGELVAFDCIEFNEQYRHIDVADEIAFLSMDLTARGHPSLAYAFLSAWAEENGDYQAMTILGFFQVERALVRAKVEILGKNQAAANRYWNYVMARMRGRRPRLILMCGLSGSGKTWMSTRLISAANAIRVRSDVERKRMAGLGARESSRSDPDKGIYTLQFNERVYTHLLETARMLLQAGESAIVDAAFLKRAERQRFIVLAQTFDAPVAIVHCVAPEEELRARLQLRQADNQDASEADVSVMQRQIGNWEAFDENEMHRVLPVNTADASAVDRLLAEMSLWYQE